MIDPLSASSVVIAAFALAHQILTSPKVPKNEKKKIAKEAERLVQLAQKSDIDKELKKGRVIDKAALQRWFSGKGPPAMKKKAAEKKPITRKAVKRPTRKKGKAKRTRRK